MAEKLQEAESILFPRGVRVQISDGSPFDEREWLRREVLWGSLMFPDAEQFKSHLEGNENGYFASNDTRIDIYAEQGDDLELQAKVFLQMGKKVGTALCGAAFFRNAMHEESFRKFGDDLSLDALKRQTRSIDIALGNLAVPSILPQDKDEALREARLLTQHAVWGVENELMKRHLYLRAAKIMTGLAIQEVAEWREFVAQNPEQSRPIISVQNGGHPRSAGPRVDMLQPIFSQILESEDYRLARGTSGKRSVSRE